MVSVWCQLHVCRFFASLPLLCPVDWELGFDETQTDGVHCGSWLGGLRWFHLQHVPQKHLQGHSAVAWCPHCWLPAGQGSDAQGHGALADLTAVSSGLTGNPPAAGQQEGSSRRGVPGGVRPTAHCGGLTPGGPEERPRAWGRGSRLHTGLGRGEGHAGSEALCVVRPKASGCLSCLCLVPHGASCVQHLWLDLHVPGSGVCKGKADLNFFIYEW